MKASALITKLQAEIEKGGDREVVVEDDDGLEAEPKSVQGGSLFIFIQVKE